MATKKQLEAMVRSLYEQNRTAHKITPGELYSALKDIVDSGEIYMAGSTRADEERRQNTRATDFGLLEQQHEKARLENLRAFEQKVAREKREMSRQQKWLHAKGKKLATLQSRITALCAQRDSLMAQPPPPVAAVRSLKKQLGIRQPRVTKLLTAANELVRQDKAKAEQDKRRRQDASRARKNRSLAALLVKSGFKPKRIWRRHARANRRKK